MKLFVFNYMNYEKIYQQIIENRKHNKVYKKDQYCELHHIIPKSLGGDDTVSNKVMLTGREHLIVHRLLVHITRIKYGKNSKEYQKMCFALFRMIYKDELKVNSRTFEKIRGEYAKMYSELMKTELNPQKGKPSRFKGRTHTAETREQISMNRRGKCTGVDNPNFGKNLWENLSEEQSVKRKEKLRLLFSGKNNPMYGKNIKDYMSDSEYTQWCIKNSIGHKRENLKPETLKKMSENNKGKNNSQYGISVRERMSPDVYEKWVQHQREAHGGENNPAFGRRWMYHPITLDRKFVKKQDVEQYITDGYIFGIINLNKKRKTDLHTDKNIV